MNKWFGLLIICALGAGSSACKETDSGTGLSGVKHDGYFAVVSTNYSGATSISLLGQDGSVVEDEWVGSKTKNPDLRTPLADDVVLPSTSFSRRYLTTIERGLGVVTRFDLNDGSVLGQLRTDESPETDKAAFHSNPQDVYYVSEDSGWVSRWAPNKDPKAATRELGSDLIEFVPSTMKRTTRRIDLSKFATDVEETKYDANFKPIGMEKNPAYARPSGLMPAGKFLVVGLVRATDNYSYAPGMIAVVDPIAGKLVGSLALTGASNCGEVHPVLDEASQVLVVCTGSFGDQGAAAGIFKLELDAKGTAKIVRKFLVADHPKAANSNSFAISLGGDLIVAIAPGSLDEKMKVAVPDAAFSIDLKTGTQTMLLASKGAYSLGVPAYDATTGVLLIPDAGDVSAPRYGVERFTVGKDGKIEDDTFVKVAPKTTLAAREAHLL
jgi:hypothetical protein